MRVLFVVSDLSYPPREGLHQQTLLLVKSLVEAGDDVRVMGFVKNAESVDLAGLSHYLGIDCPGPFVTYRGPQLGLALRNMLPAWTSRGQRRELRDEVQSVNADVVHLDCVGAAGLYRPKDNAATVASFVDPGSRRQLRFARASRAHPKALLHLLAALLHFVVERRLRHPQLTWHVVSEGDRDYLKRVHHHTEVTAIPVMLPGELGTVEPAPAELFNEARPLVLVYGDLRRPDMREAFIELFTKTMPQSALAPTCRFLVLGRVEADAELEDASSAYDRRFIAWVDDYIQLINSCDIVILPDTTGTGIKNRAVQSLALGKPIVGTLVAFEDINIPSADFARVALSSHDFALNLDELCASSDLRAQIGANARELAISRYSQAAIVQRWRELYRNALSRQSSDRRTNLR